MPIHPFDQLSLNGESVNVDSVLAPLIQKLWDNGIITTDCCQGESDPRYPLGYIAFKTTEDFFRFVDLLQDPTDLFNLKGLVEINRYGTNYIVLRFTSEGLPEFVSKFMSLPAKQITGTNKL